MQNEMILRRRKWLIFGSAGVLILILLISLGFMIYGRVFSARVNIMVAPSTAIVKIGELEFGAFENTVEMQPGEYAVTVTAEGFTTKTGWLIARADETVELSLYLEPNSEATANWYETHAGDALIRGEIQNREALKALDDLLEKEPALKQLPMTVEYYSAGLSNYTKYTISYELDAGEGWGFYLIVKDYTGVTMEEVTEKLNEIGMDTAGVRIQYEDLTDDGLGARAEG